MLILTGRESRMERGCEDVVERKGAKEREERLYKNLRESEAKLIRGFLFQTELNYMRISGVSRAN